MKAAEVSVQSVALLSQQADALRTEIARLQQELSEAQASARQAQAAELREANSQLVLSALRAAEVAETAANELDELAQISQRDALTGAANRAAMLDRLESATALARRHGTQVAVLFLDLDRFKDINDSLGHAAGDEVLQQVAKRLDATLRDSDTISRYGGDEFLVLLPDVGHATDAALAAAKVLLAIAEPSFIGEQMLHLSASVGISIYPADGSDPAKLIAAADAAMYRSKRRGRGGFAFHNEGVARDSLSQEQETRRAALSELEERVQALRQANEKITISALTAREMETQAKEEEKRGQLAFLKTLMHEVRAHQAAMTTGATPVRAHEDAALLVRLQDAVERRLDRLTR